jgi:hypothetical protein
MAIRITLRKSWLPALAAAVILPTAAATAAVASSHPSATVTAITWLVHRADSGGNGNWAYDKFSRTAQVTYRGVAPLSACGTASGHCYAFTASLSDTGAFTTIKGAFTPNQGAPYTGTHIASKVTGPMHGYGLFTTFFATAMPQAGLVPHYVYGNAHPSYLWPGLFFPASAKVTGLNENDWGYYYTGPHGQSWVDASFNNAGQDPVARNITG